MFSFRILTPDHLRYEAEVEAVSLPTPLGDLQVLTHHAELASLLTPGVIRATRAGKTEEFAVSGGFLRVDEKGGVRVTVETAEQGEELDLSVIEEAKQRAADVMKQKVSVDDVQFAAAAAALERELAREKVAVKYKRKR
jgi:F-type H+-transporting ATPase subunit epsilon